MAYPLHQIYGQLNEQYSLIPAENSIMLVIRLSNSVTCAITLFLESSHSNTSAYPPFWLFKRSRSISSHTNLYWVSVLWSRSYENNKKTDCLADCSALYVHCYCGEKKPRCQPPAGRSFRESISMDFISARHPPICAYWPCGVPLWCSDHVATFEKISKHYRAPSNQPLHFARYFVARVNSILFSSIIRAILRREGCTRASSAVAGGRRRFLLKIVTFKWVPVSCRFF